MRHWLSLLFRIGAIIALMTGSAQAQLPCDQMAMTTGHIMPVAIGGKAGYHGVDHQITTDHAGKADHSAAGAVCKHLCLTVTLAPIRDQGLSAKLLQAGPLRLPDGPQFASQTPDQDERPPKLSV